MGLIEQKLQTLAEDWGYLDAMELAEHRITDSLCPAICMTPGCDYSTEYEPDQRAGWCEECNKGTCRSALDLMGII